MTYLIIFTIIIIIETIFNVIYRKKNGITYKFIKKIPLKKFLIEPHPYLSFSMKKDFNISNSEKLNYNNHKNFYTSDLKTNNLGFLNGIRGNRKIQIPKPSNLFRINCLGASTTGNYITYQNKNYSYPLELEKILKKKSKKRLEVNNCGQGGYNSADILIRLILQIIDTKPNMIILYHAYNDIRSYLTPNFTSDYSHSRKNFGEAYWRFWLGSKIPNIPINFINYLINKILPSNHRHSLLETVSKGKINLNNNFKPGLETFERNLQNIIDICYAKKIKLILCTFCFYIDSKKISKQQKIFKKIIKEENYIIKKLAIKNKLKLVDCYNLIPKNKKYFVDTIHFSPDGMTKMAQSISKYIKI
jgi:lysophospholipase L1-like esterase